MLAITSLLQPSSLRQFLTFSQSPEIQIFVEDYRHNWHIALAYNVSLDSPISSLKAAIEEAEGKLVAQQRLEFQGQELEDIRTFSSYNISDGSILQLLRPIQIFVKTLTGKTVTCNVDLDEPTLFLKSTLCEKEGIPVEQQRIVFSGMSLDNHRTLASYKIQKESTLHLVLRLAGGGWGGLAYAVACCPWDGNMNHRATKGLKLSHRGMMVVITEKRDKNWYSAREPDNLRSDGVVPCHFVHIVKYLSDDFRLLDLNPSPKPGSFPFSCARMGRTYYCTESEMRDIEELELNDPARELPQVPSGPLPPFLYPWAEPRIFSRGFANRGHSMLEISITYNPEAVPSEPTLLNVTFKCRAIGSRVSEASIQVIVPNGEVADVRSPPMVLGREGETQAKFVTRNEQSLGVDAGFHGVGLGVSGTRVTEEERSGTVPTTQMSITGDSLRGDTASWLIKEAATLSGGEGLPARLSDMSFTLTERPEVFIFDCLVRLGGGKKYYFKSAKPHSPVFAWKIEHA